jgi:aryl-phospho-beta-D-glucosidase BglC (GH1 family)
METALLALFEHRAKRHKSSNMIRQISWVFVFCVSSVLTLSGCEDEEKINTLSVSPGLVIFKGEGGTASLTIRTDAGTWTIENPVSDWLEISATTGSEKETTITLSVSSRSQTQRAGTLVVKAGNAKPVEVSVSQAASQFLYGLNAGVSTLSFPMPGGTKPIVIQTDAPDWQVGANVDWINFSQSEGGTGTSTIQVIALENDGDEDRSGVITLASATPGAPVVTIDVTQEGPLYPNYNTSPLPPDITGMSSSATELAAKITLGWNIGNSLEATGGETAWGNPLISKALIDKVKASGFNAIRIPASWNQHMSNAPKAELKADWLDRVEQVVQYCIENDMYVILNIHWDGGWLENNITPEKQDENNAKQKAFWEQIATHFRDFDERLLFASANEPNVENATQMGVLTSYHQTFIDAVRATGGRNTYRNLIIQGPSTDIEKTSNLMLTLPTDPTENRMMVEVHYYTPWNFCGLEQDADWGKMFYYWGEGYHSDTDPERNATWGEEETVDANFQLMKTQFVDKGIPVVLGEFGVTRRSTLVGDALTKHLASRAYYLKYVTKQALAHGLLPFYWDNGGIGNFGSGIFNRTNNTVFDQQALDALAEGATE